MTVARTFSGGRGRKRNFRKILGLALSSAFFLETGSASQVLAASAPPDPLEPSGTLLLPLTPKLDDGTSQQPFDKTPPESATRAANDAATDNAAPEPTVQTTHKIRATTADLKPAPESITPEAGEVDETPGEDDMEGKQLLKGTVQIIADDTEYDQDQNTFLGTGNAVAIIGGQNSKLEADTILYNQNTQMIDARGNVRMTRGNQVTAGSAFKFKVTSDEYLITNADTEISGSEIVARKAHGQNGGIAFRDGTLTMQQPYFMSRNAVAGPMSYLEGMSEKRNHPDAFVPPKQSYTFKARKIVYEKYKEQGNLTIYGGKLMFGNFGIPLPKMVTSIGSDQNNIMFPISLMAGNNLQSGGLNIGPTFNNAIGKTGILMWAPMVQFGGRNVSNPNSLNTSSLGLAGQVSYTNNFMSSHLGYGSVSNLLVGDLKIRIRRGFKFQNGINRYLDDGMFGTRRARLLTELVDNHPFTNKVPFLSTLNFRSSAGAAQDDPQLISLSPQYAKLFGNVTQTKMTAAIRVQEQVTASSHPLFSVGDSRFGVKSYIYGGVAGRAYSTGNQNTIGQIGPVLDMYLGRVRLQTGYTQSAYQGSSPFVFDQFIQGTRSVTCSGDVRLCRYITVGGGIGYNLVDKLYYGKTLTAAFGPDDFKLLTSYNMVQGTYRVGFDVLYGQPVPFQKLVMKNGADQGQLGGI